MIPAAAAIIGAAASAAGNIASNDIAFNRQKQLNQQKYEDMIKYAQQFGATPTSIIHGITGSAGGAVPTLSTSNNPVPDFGDTLNRGIEASAAERQSFAAKDEAAAATMKAETERQLGLMKLRLEPAKYFADIKKSLAEAFSAFNHGRLHGSMKEYYNELTRDLQLVRPWKIAGLKQGLINDMATYGKILQETNTLRAQQGYYGAAAYERQTAGDFNLANKEYIQNQSWNEHLRGFRIQWENTLLAYGIDPTKGFWENTGRLMVTNPTLFKERMSQFISGLNIIDERLQFNLGQHYKRNALIGYGLYKLNQIHQSNANSRSMRFRNYGSTISSFIPFAGGSSGVPGPNAGVDWWMKD